MTYSNLQKNERKEVDDQKVAAKLMGSSRRLLAY